MTAKKDRPTAGGTGSITEELTDSGMTSFDELLGPDSIDPQKEPLVLVRLKDGQISSDLAEALNLQPYRPNLTDHILPPVVLGPLPFEKAHDLASMKLLNGQDMILKAGDRWKSLRVVFPDLLSAFSSGDDLTRTSTVAGGGFEENRGTPTGETQPTEGMELEDLAKENLPRTATDPTLMDLQVEGLPEPLPAARQAPGAQKISPRFAARPLTAKQSSTRNTRLSAVAVILILGGGLWYAKKMGFLSRAALRAHEKPKDASLGNSQAWPEKLQPQPTQALHAGDSSLVAKIRPILTAYERGATLPSATDEELLKTVADPAAASWEARMLAANQLAVFYLSTQRTNEAKRVLNPIYEAAPSDPTTLFNLALIHLVDGDFDNAREVGNVGLRLAPQGLTWLGYSIIGLIDGANGKLDDAEKSFENAANRASNNPFIYGMWIQSLVRADPTGRGRVPKLIRDALWANPDRLVDSPIPAPLAGHLIVAEALDGFKKGAEWPESHLRPGQISFFRWLDARTRFNPLSQSLPQVMSSLASETEPQSQLLYAYGLKEQGNFEEASKVMDRLMPQIEKDAKVTSSWPWTFAGDLQSVRGHPGEAMTSYQTALNRNSQDSAAAYGLALLYREKGDFILAEQKLREALALDPLFVPAELRVSRFEWHRRYYSK